MSRQTEVELKFLVPKDARQAVAAEMARSPAANERQTLAAMYLDTDDRRVAHAGMAWRLRREGPRWIQTLKAKGSSTLGRFEHEVIRPDASHDVTAHAGTPPGDKLLKVLRNAREDGLEVGIRFRTEVQRIARRVRTRGAVVEVAFDEGRLLAGTSTQKISELEFELVSGSPAAMLGLAERWRKRYGMLYDPRSKAERGDRLAEGSSFPPVRKASLPDYPKEATAIAAFGAVLDECLAQISRNVIGLIAGDPAQRVEHVHQVRVGIRRLRSALRSFEGWVPTPPDELVHGLRELFTMLGQARDSDVLGSGVIAELAKVGAPPIALPVGTSGPDPVAALKANKAQQLLLAWLTWRTKLEEALTTPAQPLPGSSSTAGLTPAEDASEPGPLEDAPAAGSEPSPDPQAVVGQSDESVPPTSGTTLADVGALGWDKNEVRAFHQAIERRLRRWHRRIASDWKNFDNLDEESLHSLRKRIKRQRYAVEFFAPVLRTARVKRYLKPLTSIQDRMGELNDLFVARAQYQNLVASDPAAWFALGWLAAHIRDVRELAKPELKKLAKADPPVT